MLPNASVDAPVRRDPSRLVAAAAAIVILMDAVAYVALLRSQSGDDGSNRVYFIFGWMLIMAAASAWAAVTTSFPWRVPLVAFAASGLMATGVLGVFSIGLPLLLASGLMITGGALALSSGARPVLPITGAAILLAVAALIAGLYWTDLPVRCPSGGVSGGGSTMFHGSYSYTCAGDRFTLHTR